MDRVMDIGQREAEETMRALARSEGIFAGAALQSFAVPLLRHLREGGAACAPCPTLTEHLVSGSHQLQHARGTRLKSLRG